MVAEPRAFVAHVGGDEVREQAVRPPAVAGTFYPRDAATLARTVRDLLGGVTSPGVPRAPAALVVPHAGYVYSGPVAATAYRSLVPYARRYQRVALFGPAHFVPFRGLALPSSSAFATPLGEVPVDAEGRQRLSTLPYVRISDEPHEPEHSLEVQLPFLQVVLPGRPVLPVACGDAEPEEVAEAMERALEGDGALLLVSTDLSHYFDWATARRLDEETARAVESLRPDALGPVSTCGRVPLRGLLIWAAARNLEPVRLDLRNSGDTAGDPARVVGYGAWAFLPRT